MSTGLFTLTGLLKTRQRDVVLQTPSQTDRNNTSAGRGASGLGTTNLQQIKFLARALAQLRSEPIMQR
jgi:hypothetical protein